MSAESDIAVVVNDVKHAVARLDNHAERLDRAEEIASNLALVAAKHDSRLAIVERCVYSAVGMAASAFFMVLLRKP